MATEKPAATPPAARARTKAPSLTEKDIVNAALDVIRSEGVEALSMRRLSRELERSAMAPYWHVADKQQLLDLVAKEVLSEVVIPAPDSGPWDDRLRGIVAAIDVRLREHPGIADVLFARMQSNDRRLILGIMEILRSAGFSDTDVLLGYAMIHTYLFGRYQVVTRADWDVPEEVDETLARLLPLIPQLRGKDFFTFGVDTIIDGLHARLAASTTSRTSRRKAPVNARRSR
jgi:TetR/AcrR family transcriptional regulator, tetracycline repressor protein